MRSTSLLLVLSIALAAAAAETGDFDGDGRISLKDVVHYQEGLPPAPGSIEAFEAYASCHAGQTPGYIAASAYLESLRRGVPGSLAHWHRIYDWRASSPPLPADPRFSIRLRTVSAAGGTDDRVRVQATLLATAQVRAFSLVLESEGGILRVANARLGNSFGFSGWWDIWDVTLSNLYRLGDLRVATSFPPHLLTGGKYVMTYGTLVRPGLNMWGTIDPGEYELVTEARLPKGTARGRYAVRLLEGSEVLLEDGTLIRPFVEEEGEVIVLSDVTEGWNEGAPPLELDPAAGRVLGKIEFRVADELGRPAEEGQPVAGAAPGEIVTLRVQMRTEVPLNQLYFRLQWTDPDLVCFPEGRNSVRSLFTNPEDGLQYLYDTEEWSGGHWCTDGYQGFPPGQFAAFFLQGSGRGAVASYPDRPLEYFKPLGEWVDLTEVQLKISDCAPGGKEIPLTFRPHDGRDPIQYVPSVFMPYSYFHCRPYGLDHHHWLYDITYHPAHVKVLGQAPACGGPPPDLGIRFLLGDAAGAPGEEVEVPVLAALEKGPAYALRLALELDPQAVSLDEVVFKVLSRKTGEIHDQLVTRASAFFLWECDDPRKQETCTGGAPATVAFRFDTEERFAVLDMLGVPADYPGPSPVEIARLRVKVKPDFTGSETVIRPARVPLISPNSPVETGGYLPHPDQGIFSPAAEIRAGTITISGKGFIRSDANADGLTDLSDAIATLGFLFLGQGDLPCRDAVDTDDNGLLDISDPIFLLGVLFLGSGKIPEPFPRCGPDGTNDGLGCLQATCGQG